MIRKKKICKTCGDETYIWSNGECQKCSNNTQSILSPVRSSLSDFSARLRGNTTKGKKVRQKQREGLTELFRRHVEKIEENKEVCRECGCRLIGDVSEVAHILPKSLYRSIQNDDDNIIYLCGWMSESNCHAKFDGSNEQLWSMSIFPEIKEKVKGLFEKCGERIPLKHRQRWEH